MSNRILRVAAVVSSLTLAAGFIGYRTGAFTFGQTAPDPTSSDRVLIYSSKSGAIVPPSTSPTTTPTTQPAVTQRTMMSGSKTIVITSIPTVPAATTAPVRVTLPGSKSDIMIPPATSTPNAPAK